MKVYFTQKSITNTKAPYSCYYNHKKSENYGHVQFQLNLLGPRSLFKLNLYELMNDHVKTICTQNLLIN